MVRNGDTAYCRREIDEIIEDEHLADADQRSDWHGNAQWLYGLKPLD